MKALIDLFVNHGTKLLGVLQGVVATLIAVPQLIPQSHAPYWMGAFAVLTYLRGVSNSKATDSKAPDRPSTPTI